MKGTKYQARTFNTAHFFTENIPYPNESVPPSAKSPQIMLHLCILLSPSTSQLSFSLVSGLFLHDSVLQESFPPPLLLDALLLVQMARQGKSGASQRVTISLKTAWSQGKSRQDASR